MTRTVPILVLSLAIALALSRPAGAKVGPISATIVGPGISTPMTVHDGDLEALVGSSGLVTGFWRKACRDSGGCIRRPDHLGPWYMVTYTLVSDEKVVQLVYPYSSGGPVAYVPPDQRFFRTQRTTGVWYVGALPLRWSLERLGVPLSTPSVEPVATAAPPGQRSVDGSAALVWPAVLVVCVAIAGAAAFARSRREHQPAGVASNS